jgi:SAM-dependent methyltransferase
MLTLVKSKAIARGLKNAIVLLSKGEWQEFLVRVKISLGQVDLKHDSSETVTDRTHYYADSSGLEFEKIMNHFPISSRDAIVDFGCGKGGILITLSKYPFAKIAGVEISPDLVAIAEKNIKVLNLKKIEIFCSDAVEFKQLDDFNYIYFFDPFPAVVMQDVLKNIEQSIINVPREVTIIYLNPFCHDLIETKSAFKKVREMPHFEHKCFVYSNAKE